MEVFSQLILLFFCPPIIAERSYEDKECGVHAFLPVIVFLINQFYLDAVWNPRKGSLSYGQYAIWIYCQQLGSSAFALHHCHQAELLINLFCLKAPNGAGCLTGILQLVVYCIYSRRNKPAKPVNDIELVNDLDVATSREDTNGCKPQLEVLLF